MFSFDSHEKPVCICGVLISSQVSCTAAVFLLALRYDFSLQVDHVLFNNEQEQEATVVLLVTKFVFQVEILRHVRLGGDRDARFSRPISQMTKIC